MKRIFVFLFFFQFSFILSAQNRNSIWCFGDSAGINFSNVNNPIPITTAIRSRGSAVSIADSTGSLLFYAYTRATIIGNTTQVISANDSLMLNGGNVVGEGWYRELVIVPDPVNSKQYYLFCNGVTGSSQVGLFYSKIDLNLNGGLGEVTQKNILLSSNYFSDGIQAIKHGNGRDWWLIARQCDITTNEHYLFLISPSGISAPYIQMIGTPSFYNTTRLDFSPDGQKLAEINYAGLLEILDFDRCTGTLSNLRILHAEGNPFTEFWDSEWSPNQNILYVGTDGSASYLLQLNLLDFDPWGTNDTLWFQDSIQYSGGQIELAPDGNIYYASAWYDGFHFNYPYPDSAFYTENMNLGVINNPDMLGSACNFLPYSFYLAGHRTYVGLPNNPNYELGPDTGSICDTITFIGQEELIYTKGSLNIFYHSGWQIFFINANGLQGNKYSLTVYDLMGRAVFNEEGKISSEYFTKDLQCSGFASGMYILTLQTEREKLVNRFVRE